MADLIDSLEKEEKRQKNNTLKVKSSVLEEMVLGCKKARSIAYDSNGFKEFIPKSYTAKDIEDFSKLIVNENRHNQKWEVGDYLSALINNCKENKITIYTPQDLLLSRIGSLNNGKEIIVYGNCGDYLGESMISGKITVYGNVSHNLGYGMCSGNIIVEGDVGSSVGNRMKGGSIIVSGNTGVYVGESMRGGHIHIFGNVHSSAGWNMDDGKITIDGDSWGSLGEGMSGGLVLVKGNVGGDVGTKMSGGVIKVNGDIRCYGYRYGGQIYHKDRLIPFEPSSGGNYGD